MTEERITEFVDVILPVPIHQEFTYRLPFEFNGHAQVGSRVIVPFGKAKLQTAIVTKVHQTAPLDYSAKYVEHILDDQPIVTKYQLRFWNWIARYYMAPIGDVMNAALPSNFKLASETKLIIHPDLEEIPSELDERDQSIMDALEVREVLDVKEIAEIVGIKTVQPIIKSLIDRRLVMTLESLEDKFTAKTKVHVRVNEIFSEDDLNDVLDNLQAHANKRKQAEVLLEYLRQVNGDFREWLPKQVLSEAEVSASALQTLIQNGIFQAKKMVISRLEELAEDQGRELTLSAAQSNAQLEIKESFKKHPVTLLHGITGSGKTEIYISLIQEQLDQGNQVLFLLPEIALTTQLIDRLAAYFGDLVGVYHSKFNQNERVEIWQAVLENSRSKFRVIVGARSAIFLPFKQLGLVIVDEEHESSFKQYDPSPRYNGRDAAIVLAHLHEAPVLLGSATPALETYFNAQQGKYGLVSLFERYGSGRLPEVLCADLKKETKQKTIKSHFSSFLIEEMTGALKRKEQIILFQNLRGYNPLWMCEVCGWKPSCRNCDVTLTYHKQTNTLKCHYCGYLSPPMGSCGHCGSNRIKMVGFGTEKIEDDLALLFPDARIQRLDLDTTRAKNAYARIITEFERGEIDILIGTQMVTKGLDFERVNLVGILDADMLLSRPDFRAYERSFQLMSQVAGRSGRKSDAGKVIIQTFDPDHWVIGKIHQHDFLGFYQHELVERKNFFYPPYFKIIHLTLKHKDPNVLDAGALALSQSLRNIFKERVLGPEYPIVKRINNVYLKRITLKLERDLSEKQVKERLSMLIDQFYAIPSQKSIRIVVDVDPA